MTLNACCARSSVRVAKKHCASKSPSLPYLTFVILIQSEMAVPFKFVCVLPVVLVDSMLA